MIWMLMFGCLFIMGSFPLWSWWISYERMRRHQRRRVEKILEKLNG